MALLALRVLVTVGPQSIKDGPIEINVAEEFLSRWEYFIPHAPGWTPLAIIHMAGFHPGCWEASLHFLSGCRLLWPWRTRSLARGPVPESPQADHSLREAAGCRCECL